MRGESERARDTCGWSPLSRPRRRTALLTWSRHLRSPGVIVCASSWIKVQRRISTGKIRPGLTSFLSHGGHSFRAGCSRNTIVRPRTLMVLARQPVGSHPPYSTSHQPWYPRLEVPSLIGKSTLRPKSGHAATRSFLTTWNIAIKFLITCASSCASSCLGDCPTQLSTAHLSSAVDRGENPCVGEEANRKYCG